MKRLKSTRVWIFLALTGFCIATRAQASLDSTPDSAQPRFFDIFKGVSKTERPLDPLEIYRRTQSVLDHFEVPPELDPQASLDPLQGLQTLSGAQKSLKYLDPDRLFEKFSTLGATDLKVYQDRQSRQIDDFKVALGSSVVSDRDRISEVSQNNNSSQPLVGLRIALDPGHMGGDLWDVRTGKFVSDGQGHKISEGVLALQTALLLERALKGLGAEVFLTRRSLAPVTSLLYEDLDLTEFGKNELRENVHDDWFLSTLANTAAGAPLYKAFASHPKLREIFSESQRSHYFIKGADLDARADKIQEFRPDLTLILHYDTSSSRDMNGTKAYMVGRFLPDEFASRADRTYFAKHLLDRRAAHSSLQLCRAIVRQLSQNLKIPLDLSSSDHSVRVEPGVLARNLHVSRKITGSAVSYVETLFYTNRSEFSALYKTRHDLIIDGVNYPYSDRLIEVVDALREGVLNFVRNYQELH